MLFDVIRSLAYGQHVDVWAVLAQVLSVVFVILCILPCTSSPTAGWPTSWGTPPPSWRAASL